MKKIYLDDGWSFTSESYSEPVAARVPGCMHADLRRAELIPDIFYRDNNESVGYLERENPVYTCAFDADDAEGVTLVLEGVDTYAEVFLNGVKLGDCDDMFIPYEFNTEGILRNKGNELTVKFRSPVTEVEGMPLREGAFTTERMNTRRIQCTYSWDWVGRFVTMGLFRPVYLKYSRGIDVSDVYIRTEHIDSFGASVCCDIEFENYAEGGICEVDIISPSGKVAAHSEFYADRPLSVRRFCIKNPELWYPSGYGEQPLYTLRVKVGENVFDETFGIRTLRILQDEDEKGSRYYLFAKEQQKTAHGKVYDSNETPRGFQIIVNGVPVLCKGGNWVPCEPFPSEESDEKIDMLVRRAKEMGANFLRVWGGGLFEKRAFYDACDRYGMLVAQDFLMACGEYPEKEEWFIEALKKESLFAVKYLRNHPSLAFWQGDNENAVEGSDTQKDYTGRASALRGIADNIYRYDFNREFLPSSPYGGNTYGSITVGTTHTTNYLSMIFEYFDAGKLENYKEYLGGFISRFISEEGVFGAVCRPSMLKFMTEDDLLRDLEERILEYHTKGNPALPKSIYHYMTSYAKGAMGEPTDAEDRFFKYKYGQYEWVRVAFETCKRNLGYTNGLVYWMFNDCWPAALGWSFVDYYGLPKAAYYAFKRMSKEVTLSVVKEGDVYAAYVTADRNRAVDFTLRAAVKDGDETFEYSGRTKPYGPLRIELPFEYGRDKIVLAELTFDGGSDRAFYKEGILGIKKAPGACEIISREDGKITLRAKEYIHAVELEGEYIFSDDYFPMYEGEERVITFEKSDGAVSEDVKLVTYTV